MSQRAEKYARSMERRVDKLEEWENFTRGELRTCDRRLEEIKDALDHNRAECANEVALLVHKEISSGIMIRRQRREIERVINCQRRGLVVAIVLAIVALIVAVKAAGTERVAETVKPTAAATANMEADLQTAVPVETSAWEFAALYRVAEDPLEAERIAEALEAQGYFSAAVPLPWEYQDYMRTYCHLYGCPYPLALAVADQETSGQFNMDAVGLVGEVGIFQLNPGPDGAYHAELEAATGLDPATPEGNIAGGCYLLGKYLAQYEDPALVAMAYNMGQASAEKAWKAGTTSTSYTDAVLEALERWGCTVNAWAGE